MLKTLKADGEGQNSENDVDANNRNWDIVLDCSGVSDKSHGDYWTY